MADRLRAAREERSHSQRAVSERTGLDQRTLSKWEAGDTPDQLDWLKNLARYYDLSTDYLLGITDDKRPADKRSWTPESQTAVEIIDSLPAAKRAAAVAVLKAAIDLDRIEDETNLEPVGARDGGGVKIPSEADIEAQEEMIAEKDRLLALTDKMFPPDVAAEVRRLIESGQGLTESDIERFISASSQRTLRQSPELFKKA